MKALLGKTVASIFPDIDLTGIVVIDAKAAGDGLLPTAHAYDRYVLKHIITRDETAIVLTKRFIEDRPDDPIDAAVRDDVLKMPADDLFCLLSQTFGIRGWQNDQFAGADMGEVSAARSAYLKSCGN